jgi:serine/threonine protein kinase
MPELVGQQLGNYRLIHLLGRGGYAEVYLGEHIRLNSQAAIKVLHTRLASDEEVNSFQNEGRIVASLIHPHIVRVFDFDVEKDIPFMVMDYAPNGNFTVSAPLVGSNPFQGRVDSSNHIQFMVQGYNGNAPLFFTGTVHADGSLSGTYCSLGANGQCSTGAGASGTWQVNRGEGDTSQSFGKKGKTNTNARNKRNKH